MGGGGFTMEPDNPVLDEYILGLARRPLPRVCFLPTASGDPLDHITRFINELEVGTVNVWEVPGYRIEMSPFGGIKDSGLGYKEGVVEAMKSFTNVKTYSLPWPA